MTLDCSSAFDISDLPDLELGHLKEESPLSVPQDNLWDIDFFPSFKDDLISFSDIFNFSQTENFFPKTLDHESHEHEHKHDDDTNKRWIGLGSSGFARKKRRSKNRVSKTAWTMKENFFPYEYEDRMLDKRKCGHCKTESTPQWRMGPNGPKSLCNACGVRYKSGRLLPEYRPAASPTFDVHKHSNFHKKIMKKRSFNEYR